jgi:DNA repair exonuclease SbcCD nuclease subunit
MLRFLHAADLHLDSPLHHLESYEGAPVEAIRGATRKALDNLVTLAIEERARFVLIAGDVYDGDWNDVSTGLFFVTQMSRLRQRGIRVFLISGNHDAANLMTGRLPYPDNVHVFPTDRPGTVRLDDLRVAIHGQGYADRAEQRNLAVAYPPAAAGHLNIGLLHTALDGREGHAPYAPCTTPELVARGYDYWALGHIHQREPVNGNCRPRIEFPGNIQGRHVREAGAKGCLLVQADAGGVLRTEFRPLDVLRWARLAVDCTGAADWGAVLDRVTEALAEALQASDGRPLAARVELTGPFLGHDSLLAGLRRLTDDVRARAVACAGQQIWVERVRVRTTRPAATADELALAADARSELAAVVSGLRQNLTALGDLLGGDLEHLSRLLPPELQEGEEGVQPTSREWAAGLLDRAEAVLLDSAARREDDR